MKLKPCRYRLRQDGMIVASAEGPEAEREIRHYAMVYGQDAPCEIERQTNSAGPWKKLKPWEMM